MATKQQRNKKVTVSNKPSTKNTYKYNAIGGKQMTPSQMIQAMQTMKPKGTTKMKGRSLR